METTKKQKELLEEHFEECEYNSDGGDCECGKVKKGERLWFEEGPYEYPYDGRVFCDNCGLLEIEEEKEMDKFYGSKEFKEMIKKEIEGEITI